MSDRIKTHPGEILSEEFIKPMNLSVRGLARSIDVPHNRILDIINGKRGVTADTAHRLSKAFGTTARFWLNLQMAYDLSKEEVEHAREYDQIGKVA